MRAPKKINDQELLKLESEGTEQKDIAVHFGVSPAAVCKRLKRLHQIAARPAILDKLTAKEERFVMEIVQGNNQTQAALTAFDVGSLDSAKTIGCRLMKNDDIKEAIDAVMETEGLTRRYLVRKLKSHVDGVDPNVSLRATETGLKLHGVFPAKDLTINVKRDICPVNLDDFRG